MAAEPDSSLELAEAVADGRAIDWDARPSRARTTRRARRRSASCGCSPASPASIAARSRRRSTATTCSMRPTRSRPARGARSRSSELHRRRHASAMVYRAWDPRLARDVALKLLRRQPDDAHASSIIEEGRMLARIRHPHVVTVYGAEPLRRPRRHLDGVHPRPHARAVLAEDGTMGAREAALDRHRTVQRARRRARGRARPSRHQGAERHARGGRAPRADGLRRRRGCRSRRHGQDRCRHAALHGAGAVRRQQGDAGARIFTASACCCSGSSPGSIRSTANQWTRCARRMRATNGSIFAMCVRTCRPASSRPSSARWRRIPPSASTAPVPSKRRSGQRS